MSCLNPAQAWQDTFRTTKNGCHPVIFSFKQLDPDFYSWKDSPGGAEFVSRRYVPLSIPCGHCILCRKSRAYELTCRALMEKLAHPDKPASFITLTCDDEHLPVVFPGKVLHHRPWQLFAKRLRKRIGEFRYLMCGEYGEITKRPHYHAIIFGHDLTRDPYWNDDGSRVESRIVHASWSNGHIMSRRCSDGAIAYVAGYHLKLDSALIDESDLFSDDEFNGSSDDDKIFLKNYVKWSRHPGLGHDFLLKFPDMVRSLEQVAPDGFRYSMHSFTLVRGRRLMPFHSRYLLKILKNLSEFQGYYDKLPLDKFIQMYSGKNFFNTPLQLRTKFDTIQASKERGMFLRHLHSPPDCVRLEASKLKNRAELLRLKLATESREPVA